MCLSPFVPAKTDTTGSFGFKGRRPGSRSGTRSRETSSPTTPPASGSASTTSPSPAFTGWTLWAPTVRADEAAETVMAALCAHILVEAGLRFIPTIEVLLESHHGMFSLAKKKLVEAGFKVEGEKVLVAKDLTKEIPPVPTGIRIEPAADIFPVDLRALGRDVGMAPDDIEAWKPDSPQASLGVVAIRAGKPVGLCLAGSNSGEALLYEQHLRVPAQHPRAGTRHRHVPRVASSGEGGGRHGVRGLHEKGERLDAPRLREGGLPSPGHPAGLPRTAEARVAVRGSPGRQSNLRLQVRASGVN